MIIEDSNNLCLIYFDVLFKLDNSYNFPSGFFSLNVVSYGFRQAFEQARKDVGCIFFKKGDVDIEKIKESKYFRTFINKSKENVAGDLVWTYVIFMFIQIEEWSLLIY